MRLLGMMFIIAGISVAAAASLAVAVAAAVAGVAVVARATARNFGKVAYALLFLLGLGICLLAPLANAIANNATAAGLLLVVGLLTIVNAPFDWLSLGLTRGFLRRGLELPGGWPWVLALIDAALATVLILALSATMLVSVQLYNELVVRGGGTAPLPLEALLEGLAAEPAAPQYWWVYVLLLSTLVPSLGNLSLGGASLLRGVPSVMPWLAKRLPVERRKGGRAAGERYLVATVLTLQWGLGVVLAIAAQALLIVVILQELMPSVGLGLLELMQRLVALNLPGKLLAAF